MGLFKSLGKYLPAFYLVICASASFAAANGQGLPSDMNDPMMHSTYESSIKTCLGTGSECFTGYSTSSGNTIADMERSNIPVGSMNDFFKETAAITLHKEGDRIIWSLAPSVSKFSLNPIEDVKKLQVMLHFTLWF
jgi:hypothetical protein